MNNEHKITVATFWLLVALLVVATSHFALNLHLRARVERLESGMATLSRHTAELANIVAETIKEKDGE